MRWFLSLIAILLLGFAIYFAAQNDSDRFVESPPLGQVVSVQGQVMGQVLESGQKVQKLQAHSPLYPPMRLITGLESEVTLIFGERFRVFSQSTLLLEKVGPKFRVHLLKGRLLRNEVNTNTEFIANGLPADPQTIELKVTKYLSDDQATENVVATSHPKKIPQLSGNEANSESVPISSSPSHFNSETRLQKSQEQNLLRETISLHQRFLEKCFIQHFERLKGQTQQGQVLMKFVIQKDGRLRDVSIKKSPYADKDFHKCLMAVMKRVRIKKVFERDTPVEFPIQISLP
ncbi:MAG: hypothetical protein COW84_08065 [Gammaproteobacteria bacterium CG22_combo_CG10-13_8_21_14_all_40_8]|nr:MAG: hypothetical protein COW84_08065 [Gammaproteobacteria bacterium CG22_combo_CG10-13_8_21_14_all_40_8]